MQPTSCHPMRALALASAMACAAGSADAASDWAGLVGVKPEGAKVMSASSVSGPSTIGGTRVTVAFCRVEGVARPSSDSEIDGSIDYLYALMQFERFRNLSEADFGQGVAPERIIASRVEDGKVVHQRPICRYPAQAGHKGSGDRRCRQFHLHQAGCVEPSADGQRYDPYPELAQAAGHQAAEPVSGTAR